MNTERSEFSAFPSGSTVYYAGEPGAEVGAGTYGWTGESYLRVYTSSPGTGGLTNPGLMPGAVNDGTYHIGPVAASADGEILYVTRTYAEKEETLRTREDRKRFRTHTLELYIHREQGDGTWTTEAFAHNNPSEYSVGHAALSPDGQILYFSSDMPGGHGGTDIWYSELQDDGSWGTPTNAGGTINSAGDELFPSIAPDGTLYYSSDGFAGMGGLDIFRSEGSRGTWSTPANLRHPVNSSGDDFAFVVSELGEGGKKGYLSSNRRGGVGGDDIYSFGWERPKIIIILKGTTSDKHTGERLAEASVSLYDGRRELIARKASDGSGNFIFELSPGQRYTVLGQKEGYHADSAKVSTEGITKSDTLEVALLLEPVFKPGDTFELENIYYDFDKHNIRPDAAEILDELVRTMRDNPTLRIELSSHTDSRGSHAYNEALSQRRAQSAVDYLVSRGIARDRMVAKGYGETKLVNRCANGVPCSREEHQANRRTEVTVLLY
ncbi:OmpA family protein [Parapedobacter soli]|uniref:OmpA family protein n=1 Tax=Parapedobacter soli TaxID=416955 RepID=UPI0021C8B259|nr:OmpA family protein [Parapedobacter soli]